jgi:short chain dehydrogenase
VVTHLHEEWHGDRVVIVTGGSRGTGREFARALAGAGYAVVVAYAHSQAAGDATVDEILAAGGAAIAIRADVADELDVERLFLETREEFRGVHLVVEAPGRLSALVQRSAVRHLRTPGAIVSFAGCGRTEAAADIVEVVSWLTTLPCGECREAPWQVVVLPVSDPDRAKRFYQDLRWRLDAEETTSKSFRVVRLTPPGSPTSVIFGVGVTPAVPGSARGLIVSVSPKGRGDAPWASVSDPDGNTWLLQETRMRLSGR